MGGTIAPPAPPGGRLPFRSTEECSFQLMSDLTYGYLNSISVGSNLLLFTAWKQEERIKHTDTAEMLLGFLNPGGLAVMCWA